MEVALSDSQAREAAARTSEAQQRRSRLQAGDASGAARAAAALVAVRRAEASAVRRCGEAEREAVDLRRRCAEADSESRQQRMRADLLERQLSEATAQLQPAANADPAEPQPPEQLLRLVAAPTQHAACQAAPDVGEVGSGVEAAAPPSPSTQCSGWSSGWAEAEAIAEQLQHQQRATAQVQDEQVSIKIDLIRIGSMAVRASLPTRSGCPEQYLI